MSPDLRQGIVDLHGRGIIDHAKMCNALRYLDGNYTDHWLCRAAFLACARALGYAVAFKAGDAS